MGPTVFEAELLKLAVNALVGQKITAVRYLTAEESESDMGWDQRPFAITLANGVEIIPSQDPEGNGPGTLFFNVEGLDIVGPMP